VARSVKGVIVAVTSALAFAGCTTTQHEAQRERLDSARQRVALEPTRVAATNAMVTPVSVAAVRAGGKTAFVVRVTNRGRRAVTDLPISVGYKTAPGANVFLNSAADLNYFQAHLPAIRAGGSLTWVFTTRRAVPPAARPFARVGRKRAAPALLTDTDVRIPLTYRYQSRLNTVSVHLSNPTSVPQYELQVYAYAKRAARYVGAANATVTSLGAGSKQSLRLNVVGTLGHHFHIQAVPTILQ